MHYRLSGRGMLRHVDQQFSTDRKEEPIPKSRSGWIDLDLGAKPAESTLLVGDRLKSWLEARMLKGGGMQVKDCCPELR